MMTAYSGTDSLHIPGKTECSCIDIPGQQHCQGKEDNNCYKKRSKLIIIETTLASSYQCHHQPFIQSIKQKHHIFYDDRTEHTNI